MKVSSMIGGYIDNPEFKNFVISQLEQFINRHNLTNNDIIKKIYTTFKQNRIEKKDIENIANQVHKMNNPEIMNDLFGVIDTIFNNMETYLYTFSPKSYIIKFLVDETSNFKILNPAGYVIETIIRDPDNIKIDYGSLLQLDLQEPLKVGDMGTISILMSLSDDPEAIFQEVLILCSCWELFCNFRQMTESYAWQENIIPITIFTIIYIQSRNLKKRCNCNQMRRFYVNCLNCFL